MINKGCKEAEKQTNEKHVHRFSLTHHIYITCKHYKHGGRDRGRKDDDECDVEVYSAENGPHAVVPINVDTFHVIVHKQQIDDNERGDLAELLKLLHRPKASVLFFSHSWIIPQVD